MKRSLSLACVLLLSACTQPAPQLGTHPPGLGTARAALRGGAAGIALNICTPIAITRRDVDALTCQGDAFWALGRLNEADAAYMNALLVAPRSAGALLGLGRLRLANDPAQAEQLLLLALAENPREAAVLNNLGIARDLQGRHEDAQKAYGEALAADPDMRAAQVNLTLSKALSGRSRDTARPLLSGLPDARYR